MGVDEARQLHRRRNEKANQDTQHKAEDAAAETVGKTQNGHTLHKAQGRGDEPQQKGQHQHGQEEQDDEGHRVEDAAEGIFQGGNACAMMPLTISCIMSPRPSSKSPPKEAV